MDPAAGAPASSSGLVAVIGPSAALADAWSTAFFAAGAKNLPGLLEQAPDSLTVFFHCGRNGSNPVQVLGPDKGLFSITQ